jgi:hypothetical protein
VPDCYHVTSSPPRETGRDVKDCVNSAGGQGRLRKLVVDDRGRVHSCVHYQTSEQANRQLDRLTRCIESKGHTVHEARVVDDCDQLGLDRYQALSDADDTPK